ncbi:hypothetical protein ACFC5X_33650, partial [Streptomyces sp. NPDC055952]
MTTCSSSPRSNEPAIPSEPNGAAQPSAETTAATGAYRVQLTSVQPAPDPHGSYGPPPAGYPAPPAVAPGFHPAAPAQPAHSAQVPPGVAPPGADRTDLPDPPPEPPAPPGQDWFDPAEAPPAPPARDRAGHAPA